MIEGEIWRPVRGFEEHFEVSNLGTVRRISPTRIHGSVGRIIKPFWGTKPGARYPGIRFTVDGRTTHRKLHAVVFEAFHGLVPKGLEINHKDGDKLNFRWDNLEATSHKYNVRHAILTGLMPDQRGENNHQAKLDEPTARKILSIYKTGRCGIVRLGKFFKVSNSIVRALVSGRTWSHIDHFSIQRDYPLAESIRKQYPGPGGPRKPRQENRSRLYLRWIRTQPCVICKTESEIEAHHTGPHGLSAKSSDFSTIPLCSGHHRNGPHSYHTLGRVRFEQHHSVSVVNIIAEMQLRAEACGIHVFKPVEDISRALPVPNSADTETETEVYH